MIRSANPDCGRRPRPSATSHKPFGPSATKRFRQSRHVCRFTPSSSAMVKSLDPWCASKTMRQRVTTCWGVPCAQTHVSSSSCCSGFSFKAIGLLLMRPLNHMDIDLSSYFSATTLAHKRRLSRAATRAAPMRFEHIAHGGWRGSIPPKPAADQLVDAVDSQGREKFLVGKGLLATHSKSHFKLSEPD